MIRCKIEGCLNPVWSKGLCTKHNPKKPFKPSKYKKQLSYKPKNYEANYEEALKMKEFFLQIWKKRLHYSQISMDYLGKEPLSIFFHHILPKNKYPQAAFDEENIILLTLEEHDQVEMDPTRYEEINKKREQLKRKYEMD